MADIPARIGRYVVDARIGAGGMAEVYQARLVGSDGFEKTVCIKRILPELQRSAAYAVMFRDEAAIAARMQHPNVVQVFDFGEDDDGSLFIVMEYVDGISLAKLLASLSKAREVLHLGAVLKIGVDVARGLQHAHELGIVHRDISPQNILVSRRGEVKVVDFGVARAEGRRSQTQSGVVKGKVEYMAPEQILGEPIDHRLDQFATGIVLWESLTAKRLFKGASDYMVLDTITRVDAPAPSTKRPDVPPNIDAAVVRALSRDPRARFADMNGLADALTQCMLDLPVFPGDVPGPAALDLAPVVARALASSPSDVVRVPQRIAAAVKRPASASMSDGDDSATFVRPPTLDEDVATVVADVTLEDARSPAAPLPPTTHDRGPSTGATPANLDVRATRSRAPIAIAAVVVVIAALGVGAAIAKQRTHVVDARSLACPQGFVGVPGRAGAFCVAQFEMKDVGGHATSQAAGMPIHDVTRDEALARCAALGPGFHLIDNDEWQDVAHDIEAVADNWSSGIVGQGVLAVGNVSSEVGAADPNDPCATPGSPKRFPNCTTRGNDDFIRRRTHTLSTGALVWDLAGNFEEWTSTPTSLASTSSRAPANIRGTTCAAEGDVRAAFGPAGTYDCGYAPNPFLFGCLEGAGGTAVIRGGHHDMEGTPWDACPGIFYANTNKFWKPSTSTGPAFRCAFTPAR